MKDTIKLEDNQIWKLADEIARFMYGCLDLLPRDEEWATKSKFRLASNDLIFYTAQALGSNSPSSTEFEWGSCRKYIFSIKSIYKFACNQGFLEIDPDFMLKVEKLIKLIEIEIKKANKETEKYNKADMENWLKKYKLWKEMNK